MWVVVWDNGNDCGALPGEYETEQEAQDAGEDWLDAMCAQDENPEEAREVYSFEVVEREG